MVPEAGVEPAQSKLRGIFVPLRLSSPSLIELVRGLDFLFTYLLLWVQVGAVKSLHFPIVRILDQLA